MFFPLQTLLSNKLDNVRLVVDNAKSPSDPVSFRNQRSCGYCSSSTKNRWSSMPPCVDVEDKKTTTLQIIKCSNSTDTKLSTPVHIKNEISGNGVIPVVRVPIRQPSRVRIQKDGQSSSSSPATKRREKIKRSISCPMQIPVRRSSPLVTVTQRKQISVQDETRFNTTTSQTMTKGDIKSMTSNTGSRPIRIPVRRKSLKSINKGSSEGGIITISRDLAKLEKLARAGLIDKALKKRETDN
jgi:hypothetical protein